MKEIIKILEKSKEKVHFIKNKNDIKKFFKFKKEAIMNFLFYINKIIIYQLFYQIEYKLKVFD